MDKRENISEFQGYIDLIFETGMLTRIPQSGTHFLGSPMRTVADHVFRTTIIGYTLSQITTISHNPYKLICLCLFHNIYKTRTGDYNYVQQGYVSVDFEKLKADIETLSPIGKNLFSLVQESHMLTSNESILAHDASTLELLFFLKEHIDLGNTRAIEWFQNALKTVITREARILAQELETSTSDDWWKKRSTKPSHLT